MLATPPSQPPQALLLGYRINSTTQPMQMDLVPARDRPALTIFEFTADGKLRLHLEGVNPGAERPKAFSANAYLFDRVSDNTTLPENTQVNKF